MQKKKFGGNLKDQVTDAKTKIDLDWLSPEDESDTEQPSATDDASTPDALSTSAARTPAMRMPARFAVSPSQPASVPRPASSKSHVAASAPTGPPDSGSTTELPETPPYDDDMDVDLSPNTMTSNNAPSLVSDDGEYDDSDDASSVSNASEDELMETESLSDVAEINIDDDEGGDGTGREDDTPRPIPRGGQRRRRRAPSSANAVSAVKLKKDENRHVTFVTPTPPAAVPKANHAKGRRKAKRI
jgi:ADA HAT complex component 1